MLYVNYIEIKLGKKKTLLNQSLTSFYFPKITTVTQPNHLTLPKCNFSTPTERWSLCSIPWNLGGFVTMAEVMRHDFWGQVIKDGTASSKSLLLGILSEVSHHDVSKPEQSTKGPIWKGAESLAFSSSLNF